MLICLYLDGYLFYCVKCCFFFITVAPKISINCSSATILNVSDSFSCECKGEDGNPPGMVTWYKGSQRIISGEEMATLTIARVDRDDNGLYRCEAKGDEKAKAEKTVQIIVNCKYEIV